VNEFTVPKYIKRPKIIIGENENMEHPLDEAQQTHSSKPSIVNEQKEKRANNIMVVSNKKSKEEMKMYTTEKKRQQRENLKNRYGDEEYKKMRAKEIAEWRKKNKPEKPVLTEEEKAELNRERKCNDKRRERELAKEKNTIQNPVNIPINIEEPKKENDNIIKKTKVIPEKLPPKTAEEKAELNRERKCNDKRRERELAKEKNTIQKPVNTSIEEPKKENDNIIKKTKVFPEKLPPKTAEEKAELNKERKRNDKRREREFAKEKNTVQNPVDTSIEEPKKVIPEKLPPKTAEEKAELNKERKRNDKRRERDLAKNNNRATDAVEHIENINITFIDP
jgi:hypothetical protein